MYKRFDVFAITGELIHAAVAAFTSCAFVLAVFVCPAAGIHPKVRRTFLPLFGWTLDVVPAWNKGLDTPDALDRNLMFVNSCPDASDSFDVRLRKYPLVAVGLGGE